MVKLLITGYMHSGTTMLMQLLRNHPQVGWIENEQNYITYDKPKEWVLQFARNVVPNLGTQAWGEKIPFGNLESDYHAERPIEFTKRWLKYFRKSARVLHIVRHPVDVASSGITDGKPSEKVIQSIMDSLPFYIHYLNGIDNKYVSSVVYENLVTHPYKHLSAILKFLSLDCGDKVIKDTLNCEKYKFGKINPERAYAYQKYVKDEQRINYIQILREIRSIF